MRIAPFTILVALCLVSLACLTCTPASKALANDATEMIDLLATQSDGFTDDADFFAVLHADGTLVFQSSMPENQETCTVYEGSLGGYGSAASVPWLGQAQSIRTVRFAEDFATMQPTSLKCWFDGCSSLVSIDLANLDASKSTTMEKMFKDCSSLERIDNLKGFKTSSSTYFGGMFRNCASLTSLDVSHFDASHVRVLCFMFNGCKNLESLDMSGEGWKTSSLELMVHVWEGCESLRSLDLSRLDTSHVRSMTYDFNGCTSLEHLDLSNADTSPVGTLTHMFDNCPSLATVKLGPRFSFNGTSSSRQCSLPEGSWKSSANGLTYAASLIPNFMAATYTKAQNSSEGDAGTSSEESASSQSSQESSSASSSSTESTAAKPKTDTGTKSKGKAKGIGVGKTAKIAGCTYKVTSNKKATVIFLKAVKSKKTVTIPASVVIGGKRYAIDGIASNAFKGCAAKTVVVKAKGLTKSKVKGCFRGASKLMKVKTPKAKKRAYAKVFAKANSGKSVKVC